MGVTRRTAQDPISSDVLGRIALVSVAVGNAFVDLCGGRLVFRQPPGTPIDVATAALAGRITAAWCDPSFGGDRNAVLPVELRRARDAFLRCGYSTDEVRRHLDSGMDPDVIDCNGRTLLHQAAFAGCTAVAGMLVAGGACTDMADRYGMTPLHDASTRGHTALVEVLLDAGADPDVADNQSWTPVFWAVVGAYEDIVGAHRCQVGPAGSAPPDAAEPGPKAPNDRPAAVTTEPQRPRGTGRDSGFWPR